MSDKMTTKEKVSANDRHQDFGRFIWQIDPLYLDLSTGVSFRHYVQLSKEHNAIFNAEINLLPNFTNNNKLDQIYID